MVNTLKTIDSPYGQVLYKDNGLVYYYKTDDLSMDQQAAKELLKTLRTIDDSGAIKIIVVQGQRVEYSFEAQRILLTSKLLAKIAYVIQTSTQYMTAELLQDIARTFRSHIEIELFQRVEEAEAWLLEG